MRLLQGQTCLLVYLLWAIVQEEGECAPHQGITGLLIAGNSLLIVFLRLGTTYIGAAVAETRPLATLAKSPCRMQKSPKAIQHAGSSWALVTAFSCKAMAISGSPSAWAQQSVADHKPDVKGPNLRFLCSLLHEGSAHFNRLGWLRGCA